MLYGIILSIIVIISILLIIVVLLQPGQKEGLSGGLAAGMMGSSGMGARRTADLLSTSTAVLAGAFLLLSLLANFAIDAGGSPDTSTIQQRALEQPAEQAPANTDFNLPAETESPIPQQPAEDEGPDN
ncbi:MAG: preprotein translocase subunit SecG [Balneolaceae bacterium]